MKTRNGFVSNSSSSSFCIFGSSIDVSLYDEESFIPFMKKFKTEYLHMFNLVIDDYSKQENMSDSNKNMLDNVLKLDYIDELDIPNGVYFDDTLVMLMLSKVGLEYYDMMGEWFYIGRSWDSIGDDENGKEFKDHITSTMLKLYNVNCSTITEAWRDG